MPSVSKVFSVFELHFWRHGEHLLDVIRQNMEDVFVDGAMCECCQQRAVIGQQRRFSRMGDMMLFHIDRVAENDGRRTGAVRLPQQLCLEDGMGSKCFQLAAVGCHYGETSRSGHWITWRSGWAASWRAEWLIEDDEIRRRPEERDGNMEDHAALVLYSSFISRATPSVEEEQHPRNQDDELCRNAATGHEDMSPVKLLSSAGECARMQWREPLPSASSAGHEQRD